MKTILNRQVYATADDRTATPAAVVLIGNDLKNAEAIDIILEVTEVTATPSLVVTIDATDTESGATYNLLTGAAVTTVSTNVYRVGLGLTAAANLVANYPIPEQLTITVTHGDADAIDYSVGAKIYKRD